MCIIRQLMYKHSIIDCYPTLLDDEASQASSHVSIPDVSESSLSSRDDSFRGSLGSEMFACGHDKVSQDIMVFKTIAEQMPAKSLLHLLHGAKNTSKFIGLPIQDARPQPRIAPKTLTKGKIVRFSEDLDDQVKVEVLEIQRICDPELWWQADEYSSIRSGCKSLAEHFLYYQHEYIEALEQLRSSGFQSSKKIERAMDCVGRHGICRGMESQIIRDCRKTFKTHRRAVLRAQAIVNRWSETHGDTGLEQIREASLKSSLGCKTLALKLAQHDAYQALGVRWESSLPCLEFI